MGRLIIARRRDRLLLLGAEKTSLKRTHGDPKGTNTPSRARGKEGTKNTGHLTWWMLMPRTLDIFFIFFMRSCSDTMFFFSVSCAPPPSSNIFEKKKGFVSSPHVGTGESEALRGKGCRSLDSDTRTARQAAVLRNLRH